jgi:hypothetical protein
MTGKVYIDDLEGGITSKVRVKVRARVRVTVRDCVERA